MNAYLNFTWHSWWWVRKDYQLWSNGLSPPNSISLSFKRFGLITWCLWHLWKGVSIGLSNFGYHSGVVSIPAWHPQYSSDLVSHFGLGESQINCQLKIMIIKLTLLKVRQWKHKLCQWLMYGRRSVRLKGLQ